MAFPVGAAIIGGASLAGSIFGASSQSDAYEQASKEAAKVQKEIFNITREDYAPYRDIGIEALYNLAGYEKVPVESKTQTPIYQKVRVRNPAFTGRDAAESGVEPFIYQNKLVGYDTTPKTDYEWKKTGEGIDVTGGAETYKNALENLDFAFDPNDPVYKWRKSQGEENLNNFLSSRGLYNSSYGLNQLNNYNMALQSDEVNRQYNQNYLREYTQNMDLFNMARTLGSDVYNKYLNLANLGYGATGATAASGANTANQLSSNYLNTGQMKGETEGAFWSGLAAAPVNALVAYGYGKDAGLWK